MSKKQRQQRAQEQAKRPSTNELIGVVLGALCPVRLAEADHRGGWGEAGAPYVITEEDDGTRVVAVTTDDGDRLVGRGATVAAAGLHLYTKAGLGGK